MGTRAWLVGGVAREFVVVGRLDQLEPQYQGLARDRDVLSNNVRDFTVKEQETQAADSIARQSNDNISIVERAVTRARAGHGPSLMAPSNSRNTMTRPLSTRPVRSAGFETAAVPAIVGMAFSMGIGDA